MNTTGSGAYSWGSLAISLRSCYGRYLSSKPEADGTMKIMSEESGFYEKYQPFQHTASSMAFESHGRYLYCDNSDLAKSSVKNWGYDRDDDEEDLPVVLTPNDAFHVFKSTNCPAGKVCIAIQNAVTLKWLRAGEDGKLHCDRYGAEIIEEDMMFYGWTNEDLELNLKRVEFLTDTAETQERQVI